LNTDFRFTIGTEVTCNSYQSGDKIEFLQACKIN
jgi:hypothetical protein